MEPSAKQLEKVLAATVALTGLLIFYPVRWAVFHSSSSLDYLVVGSALAVIGGIGFYWLDYRRFPDVFSFLTRATAAGCFLYLLVEPPEFTLVDPQFAALHKYVEWGYWLVLPLAVASLWRPSFLFVVAYYMIATRRVVDEISGFSLSILDIRYMVDMGMFLALCACGMATVKGIAFKARFKELNTGFLAVCIAFVAIGFHLGNYFWSGYAKAVLGPNPLTWALENQTQNLMLVSLKRGVLPTGAWPSATQALFDGFGAVVFPSNLFVFIIQLGAVFAVLRVGWLRMVTLAYDAFHIGIYIVGGLFFWPWIWNNFSIYLAVRKKSDVEIGWLPKMCCIAAILLGFDPELGASARLAWWDVADIKISSVQAHVGDDQWIDVPVSFFMSHSYAASHGYFDVVRTEGHYTPTTWASSWDYARQVTSGDCPLPTRLDEVESEEDRTSRLARVGAFLRAHHRKMARRTDDDGWYNFYRRSHHHPSNPLMHDDFNHIDIRQITRYRLRVQSVCMSMVYGTLVENIVKDDSVGFEVDG